MEDLSSTWAKLSLQNADDDYADDADGVDDVVEDVVEQDDNNDAKIQNDKHCLHLQVPPHQEYPL